MSDRQLIPCGYYDAVAVPMTDESGQQAVARFAKTANGTRQVLVYFELLNAGEHTGRRLPWFGFFTKDSAKRTVESLRACGFTGDDLAELPRQPLDQIVSVTVEHNEWEGKTRARIAWVNAAGGGVVKLNNPMSDDDVRQFAAMMRTSVAKVPPVDGPRHTKSNGANGASETSAQAGLPDGFEAGPPPAVQEDDIPF